MQISIMLLTMTLNGVFQYTMTSTSLSFLLNQIAFLCLLFNLVLINRLRTDTFQEISLCTYHLVYHLLSNDTNTEETLLACSVIGFVLFQLRYFVLLQCT